MDIICTKCGRVEARTDIIESLNGQAYVFLKEKRMCPKCHGQESFIATDDVKKLKMLVANSKFGQKMKAM